ncbi:MAG: TolC family protein [Bacteroidetes bacterium]|jgi:outer membrane protein TolC|nr:TolC family protein [Bacteroidota bacterium]
MIHSLYIKRLRKTAPFIVIAYLWCFYSHAQHLDSLKVEAAENNLALKAQYKSFEAELENVTQAKAWQDPNLSFGYFISPIETRVGPQIARFSLTQMLPWFGTFKAKGNIASYKAEAEFEKFQDQKLKLFLEVAEKYYELSALLYKVTLENEQLEILNNLKSIVQSNYENNKVNLTAILNLELEIEKQLNEVDILKDQQLALVTQINHILNRPLKTPVIISHPKQILEQHIIDINDTIIENHPRLERIRSLKQSNAAEMDLAKKQTLPQFGLGVDYAIIQDRNVMTADAGQDALMPMFSITLPIFGQKNKSRKIQASLQAESIQFQLDNEKSSLKSELQIARYQYNEFLKSAKLHDRQMTKLNDILELSLTALANADIAIEEVLRLYNEHLLHHKMKIKTLVELQKIKAKINYLTSK